MGMCFQHPTVCLVTEYMEKGSLSQVSQIYFLLLTPIINLTCEKILYSNGQSISWKVKINMLKDIAKGMQYLHARDIIHRDIKSSNMVFFFKIKIIYFMNIKININRTVGSC